VKGESAVLICRCAWHPTYQGYPLLNGIASWRGWTVKFTDGICDRCLARFRAEHQQFLKKRVEPIATSVPTTGAA
jgi:hypothetical protein